MSESVLEMYERRYHDKAGSVRDYLDALPMVEIETAELLADALLESGPLSPCTVIIPVAAHQEAHNIYHAAAEYAQQDTTEPFTVVMHMNTHESPTSPEVVATLAEYERARHDFPDLDLRRTYMEYHGASIGEIRRDIWNAVAMAGVAGGTITKMNDILGVNHDIDVMKLPRHFMRTVQKQQRDATRMMSPVQTPVRHAPVLGYPNVSRVIAWNEALESRQSGSYEAGSLIPISFYADRGGINSQNNIGEVLDLISGHTPAFLLPAGWTQTSGRRFVEKLHTGPDALDTLWASSEFLPTEEYRSSSHQIKDISDSQLEDIIEESAEKRMPQAVLAEGDAVFRTIEKVNHLSDMTRTEKLDNISHLLDTRYRLNRNLLHRVMSLTVQAESFKKESVMDIYPEPDLKSIAKQQAYWLVFGSPPTK